MKDRERANFLTRRLFEACGLSALSSNTLIRRKAEFGFFWEGVRSLEWIKSVSAFDSLEIQPLHSTQALHQ